MSEPEPDGCRRPSADAWAAARRAYELEGVAKTEIARRLGVSARTVGRRAQRGGWIAHAEVLELARSQDGSGLIRLVGRLYRAFEAEIARLERRAGIGGAEAATGSQEKPTGAGAQASAEGAASGPAPDSERTARTLASLAKTLDTLIALKGVLPDIAAERVENDVLRAELEGRLARLGAAGAAADLPGGADDGGADVPEA